MSSPTLDAIAHDDAARGTAGRLAATMAVLVATSEAVLRATSVADLCQRVCQAGLEKRKFMTAAVCVPARGGDQVEVTAIAGASRREVRDMEPISLAAASPNGRGLIGTAYREGVPCVSNDLADDPRNAPWRERTRETGAGSGAAVPLRVSGQVHGVLVLYTAERGGFDDETLALVQRMADNIGFGMENFEREARSRASVDELRRSEQHIRGVIEGMEDGYYEVDLRGAYRYVNAAFQRLLGYRADELLGTDNRRQQTPEMARVVARSFSTVYRTGQNLEACSWEYLHKSGHTMQVEGSVNLLRGPDGAVIGFFGMVRDVTQRRRSEETLRNSEQRFRALAHLSTDWFWELGDDFRYRTLAGRSGGVGHAAQDEFIGRRVWETSLLVELPHTWERIRRQMEAHQPFRDVVMHRQLEDGRPFFVSVSGEPVLDGDRFLGYRGISREITHQKLAEKRVKYMATHDALTGLPNRMLFSQMLARTIRDARVAGHGFGVLFIDLDRFKYINDTLGHDAGDTLLQHVTARFRHVLGEQHVLARLGGDEFVVLTHHGVSSTIEASAIARRLLDTALEPVRVRDQECQVSASIGVAHFPDHGEDEQTLMKNADAAMYFAKDAGKNTYQVYAERIRAGADERFMIESRLRGALERGQLQLHYQPQFDLASGRVCAVEALLRWHDPELGAVAPNRFIGIAEETGLIVPIGKWVLGEACRQHRAWADAGALPIVMAVNLSARQFRDETLLADLAAVLRTTGVPATQLELEITEGVVAHEPERAVHLLHAIEAMGVRLAIDDFGTGYSSLGQLKAFPIHTLKIDRSFIADVVDSPQDQAIAQAVIALGHNLGLVVVAEGVETEAQAQYLREQACDRTQGFLYSRAVPAAEVPAMLRRHGGWDEAGSPVA
ncbi:MAG: EAL domain-containing protein [Comamonadaceae bacterium]|nr:MAG: EAL domain-containing protein [Comamonadaceae bacterium]